jgi:hypothetical protein
MRGFQYHPWHDTLQAVVVIFAMAAAVVGAIWLVSLIPRQPEVMHIIIDQPQK